MYLGQIYLLVNSDKVKYNLNGATLIKEMRDREDMNIASMEKS